MQGEVKVPDQSENAKTLAEIRRLEEARLNAIVNVTGLLLHAAIEYERLNQPWHRPIWGR